MKRSPSKIVGWLLSCLLRLMLILASARANVIVAVYALTAGSVPAERVDVYIGGRDGYHTYRIPAMVVTKQGTVLAFCEGRKSSAEDTGDIDLLLKRSHDHGRTWSGQQVVHEEGGTAHVTIGNPVPLVDTESQQIHLLLVRNYRRVFQTTSRDDGQSWSQPREITSDLDGFDYGRVLIATGPGHGIVTKSGRFIVPVWLSDRERHKRFEDDHFGRIRAGVIYSDDGKKWHAGGLVPAMLNRLHEGTVAQRANGDLVLNMRMYGSGYRALAISEDNGKSWREPTLDHQLPCPTCQASLLALDNTRWMFLNPAVSRKVFHSSSRRNLTLRTSHDEGRTWTDSKSIYGGPAGYSDLSVAQDGTILCLYENGEKVYRQRISLARIDAVD